MPKIFFAVSASGRSYFEKFLEDVSVKDKAIILAVFKDIEYHGFKAKGCDFRQIEGKLWEIKIKCHSGGFRFFYFHHSQESLCVLHSYKKQGQKAPLNELRVARKRLKEILKDEK